MSAELVTLTIDGRTARVPKGTLLVDAAKSVGINIPVFCSHEKLDPAGVCRMCLVEVEGARKLTTACTEPAREGMVVHTDTPQVSEARKSVLEFLLINHPLDCPVCDKGGECDLQDLTFAYGPSTSRLVDGKLHKPKAADLGPFIVLDEERCILCRRCTRFDAQVAQERTLVVGERAHDALITTAEGVSYDSVFSGNTIELCPVGALTSRIYRFRARPWDLTRVDAVCHGCPVGCHVQLHFRSNVRGVRLDRVASRPFEPLDDGWLCDRGRFNYGFVQSPDRLRQPMVRPQGAPRGKLVPATWEEALQRVALQLKATLESQGPRAVGAVGGGRLTNEEAFLLQKLMRQVLGSGNVDHRVAGEAAASLDAAPGRVTDLDEAAVILVVDAHPGQSAPVVDLRIRRAAARRNAQLTTLGPVEPELPVPHRALRVRPGETAPALERLARLLAAAGAAGGDVGEEAAVAAEMRARDGMLAVVWDGRDAAAGRALAAVLAAWRGLGREARLLVIGDQVNSRGAEAMGLRPDLLPGYRSVDDPAARHALASRWAREVPEGGLPTGRMLEQAASGQMGVLYLVGANLAETYPDRSLVDRALASDTFVVAQDLFLTETARLADVVLPAAPFTAREGHLTNLEGRVQPVGRRSTDAPAGTGADALTDGEIFQRLSRRVQAEPLFRTGQELAWEIQELAPARDGFVGALPERLLAAVARPAESRPGAELQDGRLRVVVLPALHGGGGTARFDRAYAERRPLRVEILLHPEDARRLAVVDGDAVEVETSDGPVRLRARMSRRVAPGTAAVGRGIPGLPWNRLTAASGMRIHRRLLEEVG
ncbi:NADH-quinone oxidoreductase subunit NuoG [Limnochorda pilosa]|uniref:NADH-quinone oxidoreductase n=1 Tax=Limnochorda pilosa TaxID=1555112 RepID=A0A0K2SPB0_LIMPI|nr:NADH-quinone oxidoreductase subunit NuoG [Limnochorda pilosa]BAS28941.1 NADH dehydrogenase I subunit G [Limnochorda pilosa]